MTSPITNILAETINDGLVMVDSDWHITYINQRAKLMFKVLDANLAELSLWDVIPEDTDSSAYRELHRAMEKQVTTEFDVFYPNYYSWHEVRAAPAGDGLCLILRDITDRQWLLRREAERAYLRNLFHDAPVGICTLRGPQHQFEYINNMYRRLVSGRNFESLTVSQALPELEAQGFVALLDNVYRTGVPYHGEETLVRYDRQGDGQIVDAYLTFTYQALRGFDAQVSGILVLVIDVTLQVISRLENERLAAENATLIKTLNGTQ